MKKNNPKIGRAHVWTPVTDVSRMPSSAWKKKQKTKKKKKKKYKKKKKKNNQTTTTALISRYDTIIKNTNDTDLWI